MSNSFNKPHLSVHKFVAPHPYKYPHSSPVSFTIQQRDRKAHGEKIMRKLNQISQDFELLDRQALEQGLDRDDVIYVQFYSDWGYELKYEQLHEKAKQRYQIVNITKQKHPSDKEKERSIVTVMLTSGGISAFIKKVSDYLHNNTSTGNPKSNALVANLENLKVATLEAFWTDYERYSFPEKSEETWWEIWLKKSAENEIRVLNQLEAVGVTISESRLDFTEHTIRLVKGTSVQLSDSLLLLDSLMEIRHPQDLNDFITHKDTTLKDKRDWMIDLQDRTDVQIDDNSVIICLLDTGINRGHPLLNNLVPSNYLYAYRPAWGVNDSSPGSGHGTAMAGLALYGDLTHALSTRDRINISHGVESYKIFHQNIDLDKILCGSLYKTAFAEPVIDRPLNPRIYSLTVTNDGCSFYGRPSAHSAALDSLAFGEGISELIFVSAGTVNYNKKEDYPNQNYIESVQDPAQAYNVITVGSFTDKDRLSLSKHNTIAPKGGMSPNNSTSTTWETQWPNKPDIVMEGGNMYEDGSYLCHHPELQPLSLDKDYRVFIFAPFDGTCAATAFATKLAAELRTAYPKYWPETIRGLIIHSAKWTKAMLQDRNLDLESDRRALIRSVGYGVPNLNRALTSANNSLTLISEQEIKPYKKEGSVIKYNNYHLYELPWPKSVLQNELSEQDVKVIVTLSYFIEPNPGNRKYARNFSYHSHDLDFKLIKRNEDLTEFKRRISAAHKTDDELKPDFTGEPWLIRERVRSKGSIKKDFLETSGAELSQRNYIAIYPKNGWYKTRKTLNKYDTIVKYSLIITIETECIDIDLYTPVQNQINTLIPIQVQTLK